MKKKTKEKKLIKVTPQSNIFDVVSNHPETAEVFLDYGLHCIGCVASSFDTIEAGAKIHGMDSKDIKEMVLRINEVIKFHE